MDIIALMIVGDLFREAVMRPLANSLVLLYLLLFNNFGLSIIGLTALIRLITMRLTLKQIKSTRAMSTVQPQLKAIQARYKNDRQKISSETFRIYKENGINPIGCLGPMIIQMPIWIGLYWALIRVLPSSPENLADLSKLLYSWLPLVHGAVPVNSSFFWLDLSVPDRSFVLPLMVGGSMWLQQKMMTFPSQDPKQQQTQQMMLWMMPLMFVFFSFSFPSGLALYWVISNLMGVAIQYFTTGLGGLSPPAVVPMVTSVTSDSGETEAIAEPAEEQNNDGQRRSERQDSRRSNRAGSKAARRKTRRGRNRGSESR